MTDRLKGKIALVSGAGQTPGETVGNGRAISILFARQGARVLCADRDLARAEETAAMIEAEGGRASVFQCDVTRPEQVEAMVAAAGDRFGGLDIVVNNVGIGGRDGPAHRLEEAAFDRTISVNLKGVWLCIKYEIPHMRGDGGGAIVNMASVAGLLGFPMNSVYAASKHGVIGLTKSAAAEYARNNIRVNAVCPGYTDTPMVSAIDDIRPGLVENTLQAVPMRRLGKPEEIAETVCFLLSDRAPFLTGQAIAIDGGLVNI